MRVLAVAGALLLLAAWPAPGAGDAHDARWVGTGVAAGAVLIEAEWLGACTRGYAVTLRDPATGAVLEQRTFAGRQDIFDTPGPPILPDVFVLAGASADPSVAFAVNGVQVIGHNTVPYLSQGLEGSYQGRSFALATVLAAWSLC